MTCHRCEKLERALRELVRVMSHQLARGEDPEEGAFDRAWVAACAALREEPAPEPTYTQLAANGWKDPRIAPSAEPRMFPIMDGPAIPWGVIAPHERQAKLNHGGQSLVHLAGRGGLSPSEAVAVLEDRKWRAMSDEAALARLKVLAGWLPPDEVERHIAKRFSEVLKLYVEDLRGEELDRKVRELVSKDMYPPGAPVMSLDDMREVLRSKEGWVSREELNERVAEARASVTLADLARADREDIPGYLMKRGYMMLSEVDRRIAEARDEALDSALAALLKEEGVTDPDDLFCSTFCIYSAIRALKSKKEDGT